MARTRPIISDAVRPEAAASSGVPFEEEAQRVRRDLAQGQRRAQADMIRFVADPDGRVMADLAERLPGRGVWIKSDQGSLERGLKKGHIARSLRHPVTVDDGLIEQLPTLLQKRLLDFLGLARRANQLVLGFDQVKATLQNGNARVLVTAHDGAADGKRKLIKLADDCRVIEHLARDEIAQAVGRDGVVHVAVRPGKLAQSMVRDARRLDGLKTNHRPKDRRETMHRGAAPDTEPAPRLNRMSDHHD